MCRQRQTPLDLPEVTQGQQAASLLLEWRRGRKARPLWLEEGVEAEDLQASTEVVRRAVAAVSAAKLQMPLEAVSLALATRESVRPLVPAEAVSRALATRESGRHPAVCPAALAGGCQYPAVLPVECQPLVLECQLPAQGCQPPAVECRQPAFRTAEFLLEASQLTATGSQPTLWVVCQLPAEVYLLTAAESPHHCEASLQMPSCLLWQHFGRCWRLA